MGGPGVGVQRGPLVISAPVFAFLHDTAIAVDWEVDELIWRRAGQTFWKYVDRRRKRHDFGMRRILADFPTVAHAEIRGYRLLSLDERLYRTAFPKLSLAVV